MTKRMITCDGNTAATNIAYLFSEVAAIYPITPSSPMGELADALSANNTTNLFGQRVKVQEMQSEAGAAGAIHGSLTAGALTTTFTASQGLLLMLPNMFKIAGEMLPTVFHVASRSLAYQALSIYADHSDVMAVRGTGFALLASSNVQQAQDLAAIAHLSSIDSGVPFVHFFDGFRTSHEVQKIEAVETEDLKSMLCMDGIRRFKNQGIRPEQPYTKVGAENPDVYFQGRETVNKYYTVVPEKVKSYMKQFGDKTGRYYDLFTYCGHPEAEKIIIAMGSATQTVKEAVEYLCAKGEKVGGIAVHLYRPFPVTDFISCVPSTVKQIAVLDRTKEVGSIGEPLYLDVVAALQSKAGREKGLGQCEVIGGRYGLSSKEFTPSMVKAVFDHIDAKGWHGFTVGITDDVTHLSIPITEEIDTEPKGTFQCKFWGYGSDGTVSANKNAIKIIGENTPLFVQGHFAYDSKKSGGITISHLRFGKEKIRSTYEIVSPDFVAVHKESYIGRYDLLAGIKEEGIFLLNSKEPKENVFASLTKGLQETIKQKRIKFYAIDADAIAQEAGLGHIISTIMETAFFSLTDMMDKEEAIKHIKESVEHQFKRKGQEVIDKNIHAIDLARNAVYEVSIPTDCAYKEELVLIPHDASGFAKDVIEPIMRLQGNAIPVSKMPLTGAVPTATSKLEKRGVAPFVPSWKSETCIQCGICSMVCPHAAIRVKQIAPKDLEGAPNSFETIKSNTKNTHELQFKVQVYPEDCVSCGLCVENCPTKIKSLEMTPIEEARCKGENENQKFFDALPDNVTEGTIPGSIKESQLRKPYFEFSGACAGCGETPYVKLLTQLFGNRMVIANATGCSSIFGGTFPTTPYCVDKENNGPAWANSLFEDNAEYGFGMKIGIEQNRALLKSTVEQLLETGTTETLRTALREMLGIWNETDDNARAVISRIKEALPEALAHVYGESAPLLQLINELQDYFLDKSVWILGGDGWAYDIGFGGLDHVLAQGKNVNVLVLDTETYSNTGGQSSKATPRGATAKFAISGKETPKKNLGAMMMTYGNVYVASVNMGADRTQVIKALLEAERYDGPSIVIAYSPCIAHGVDLKYSEREGKLAADSGYWPIYRYNPSLVAEGKSPFMWESKDPKIPFKDYILQETRYKALQISFPERAEPLYAKAEEDAKDRFVMYKQFIQDKKEE